MVVVVLIECLELRACGVEGDVHLRSDVRPGLGEVVEGKSGSEDMFVRVPCPRVVWKWELVRVGHGVE